VIEFGRNVLHLDAANSTEINEETAFPVINMMEEQKKVTNKGGTMRLGSYPCDLKKGSKAFAAYGKAHITERHRHRYEFNSEYLQDHEDAGMFATGINPDSKLVEIVQLKHHPCLVGAQFHPELQATVANPHPLSVKFDAAAVEHAKKKQ